MEYRGYLPKRYVEMLPCMAAFAVVVETGSFVDASIKLGLTASAVSKQIAKLENALSLRLLERTTRQLRVNAEGAEIYAHCKEVLDSSANVFRLKDRLLERPQGLVRIMVPTLFQRMCEQLLPEFLRRYPEINVRLIANDDPRDLITEGVDIGISITDAPPLGLVARKLFQVGLLLCASERYLQKSGQPVHPRELRDHSCIPIARANESELWTFSLGAETCSVTIAGRYCSDSPDAVLHAALSGLGICCLPTNVALDAIRQNRLIHLLPGWHYSGAYQGMAWMLYAPGKHTARKIKVTADYLLSELRGAGGL